MQTAHLALAHRPSCLEILTSDLFDPAKLAPSPPTSKKQEEYIWEIKGSYLQRPRPVLTICRLIQAGDDDAVDQKSPSPRTIKSFFSVADAIIFGANYQH